MCWRADTRLDDRELRRLRSAIKAHVATVVNDNDDVHAIEQIVGELIGNVQRYAPGPFCTELHWSADSLRVSVHDPGPCFDANRLSETNSADWEAERGRGFPIIKALGGVVETHRADHQGCRVSVALTLTNLESANTSSSACPHEHPAARGEHCPRIQQFIADGRNLADKPTVDLDQAVATDS